MNVYFSDRPLEPRSHIGMSQVTTGCAHGVSSSQVNKGRDEPMRDKDGRVWADSDNCAYYLAWISLRAKATPESSDSCVIKKKLAEQSGSVQETTWSQFASLPPCYPFSSSLQWSHRSNPASLPLNSTPTTPPLTDSQNARATETSKEGTVANKLCMPLFLSGAWQKHSGRISTNGS